MLRLRILVPLMFLWLLPCSTPVASQSVCSELKTPARLPSRANSGAWLDDRLVLPDLPSRALLQYAPGGRLEGEVGDQSADLIQQLAPMAVKQKAEGLALQLHDGRFASWHVSKNSVEIFDVFRSSHRTVNDVSEQIDQIFDWDMDHHLAVLYAFADIRTISSDGHESWSTGFVRVPLAQPERFTMLTPALDPTEEADRRARLRPRLGYPHVAISQDHAYFLDPASEGLSIFRVRLDLNAGKAVRVPLKNPPDPLKEHGSVDQSGRWFSLDYVQLMSDLLDTTMPVAIYSWEDSVYLLWRAALEGWRLSEINPNNGVVLGTLELALEHEGHLFLVPGDPKWVLVERGPALDFLQHSVKGMRYIDRSRFSGVEDGTLCN